MRKREKRPGGGGRFRSPSNFDQVLQCRIELCKDKYDTVDQLIDHLRATFPDYGRHKFQPFARRVQDTLQIINTVKKNKAGSCRPSGSNVDNDNDNDSTTSQSPANKRMKRIDRREEKLQLWEAQHMLKQKSQKEQCQSVSTSSVSLSSSSDDAEDGAVSSSEDAIYGEKFEPEFDLMKSMLQQTYTGSKTVPRSKAMVDDEKKTLELEVIDSKTRKLELIQGDRTGAFVKDLGSKNAKASNDCNDAADMGEKGGLRFKDLGGISAVLEELKMEVLVPLYHPQLPQCLGVRPMSGILFHGPPGCGKTKLAHAIANETGVPFYKISATELVSGVSGASEENVRELFSKAYKTAPSIVFIDEIDAIASKRENLQREMERRIVTQLMTCMDESQQVQSTNCTENLESLDCRPGYVLVIGATNRPDAVDPALRRPGRFDREISLGIPDENARLEILSVLTRKLKLEGAFDLAKLATITPGFVGADLAALVNKAGNLAIKRIIDQRKCELSREFVHEEISEEWWKHQWSQEEMDRLNIIMTDFEEAAKMIQPSSRREGFSSIPNVKWEDVGGLDTLRQEFDRYIVRRIKYPKKYEEFGVDLETGFLLYGPPGCGKTLIAKAVAHEAGANFIHIKGPELLNKYVGESELAVRTIFSRARTCSPCILFFDEVDALTTMRGKEGGWVVERLLNQLLIELDGAEQRPGVYVIGATNRPEVMDRAVLRPGRFGKLLYVPLPCPEERGLILRALSRKKPIDDFMDLMAFGKNESCKNLSGADLAALTNEAAMVALEERLTSDQCIADGKSTRWTIKERHFGQALKKISRSVSDKQVQYYQRLSESFNAA